ncbi:MAG: hemolysin family protein [Cyanobacteria bacterium P01_C01_bin.89]
MIPHRKRRRWFISSCGPHGNLVQGRWFQTSECQMSKCQVLRKHWTFWAIATLSFYWAVFPDVAQAAENTMPDAGGVIVRSLSVLVLIAINGFFVTAEFAMVSVRRSRINQLVEEGDASARTVQQFQQDIERLLSTTQLGITLSSLALGWIGERAIAQPLAFWLQQQSLPPWLPISFASHSIAIVIAFTVVAYLQIVLGELCPKSLALLHAEQLARVLGPPSVAIARIFHPFIWILNRSTRCLLGWLGIDYGGQSWHSRVTPEELQLIIATDNESTGLEADERELLQNIFEFGDVTVEEVMTPRPSMACIQRDATLRELLQEIAITQYTRYPVSGESIDDICGMVPTKIMVAALANPDNNLDAPITHWIRPVRFVAKSITLDELLKLMQRNRTPMVIVVDDFGGTAGLATLGDVIEEIIGPADDSEREEGPMVEFLEEQMFRVRAQIDVDEANELLGLELPLGEDYQTLAGFVIYQLQRIPQPDATFTYGNWHFTVESTDGPRIDRVLIQRQELDAPLPALEAPADAVDKAVVEKGGDRPISAPLPPQGTTHPEP